MMSATTSFIKSGAWDTAPLENRLQAEANRWSASIRYRATGLLTCSPFSDR